jgi:hypothetical protein
MTKDDAVDLILHAAELSQGGETFVLKMPIIQLIDLFEAMKIVLAIPKYFDLSKKYNYRGVSIPKNPQNFFKDIKPLSQNQIVKILKKIY